MLGVIHRHTARSGFEMDSFYTDDDDEVRYFKLRDKRGPDTIFVSKVSEFKNSITGAVTSKRYIRKVFDKETAGEIVKVKGELILRCSPTGRDQIKVIVYDNDNGKLGFVLQKFRGDTGNPGKNTDFHFYNDEFSELLRFLLLVRFIDLSDFDNFQLSLAELKGKVLVNRDEKALIEALKAIQGEDRLHLLEQIRDQSLTKQDLDILSGRRKGLETFHQQLYVDKDWTEPKWQAFFQENTWIFGYGLDYRFLSILQKEASLSDTDLDGTNTVQGDFLLGSTHFTVIVELKRPDTPIFGASPNRSRSWSLSTQLIDAVSQILAQKASWEIKATQVNYVSDGNAISQKTCDPKCVLVLGRLADLSNNHREQDRKIRTFEMFRRDSRNIEILTYDELYERAYYIVNQALPKPIE